VAGFSPRAAIVLRRAVAAQNRPAVRGQISGDVYLAAFIWLLAQVFGNLAAVWLSPSCYRRTGLLWIMLGVGIARRETAASH